MRNLRSGGLAAVVLALSAPLAGADNHKWEIAEVFSSADGAVQFIELVSQDKDEHLLAGQTITTASGGFFVFPSNLSSSATEGRRVLLATAAFAAVPGAPTPDYLIPAGFIDRTGDTVTYTSTPDALAFGALPVDGRTSITGTGSQVQNSPTNFAGSSSSLVLATSEVWNGSGINAVFYTAPPPVMGQQWTATIDTTHHAGNTAFALVFRADQNSGLFYNGYEILMGGTRYFRWVYASNGGVNQVSMNVLNDISLLGLPVTSQAVVVGGGGGRELSNALQMTMGW